MPPSRWGPQRCRRSPIAHLCPFARSLHGLLWALYTMWAPALLPQTAAALRAQACSECASAGEGGGKLVDFGPDGFHDEALEVQLPAFQCWLPYGPVYPWKKQLANKLRLVEWCRTHPGVGAVDLKRPLWVVGLPRTGSTIFHKLMAVRPPVHQSTSPPVHQSTSPPVHHSTTPPVYHSTAPTHLVSRIHAHTPAHWLLRWLCFRYRSSTRMPGRSVRGSSATRCRRPRPMPGTQISG